MEMEIDRRCRIRDGITAIKVLAHVIPHRSKQEDVQCSFGREIVVSNAINCLYVPFSFYFRSLYIPLLNFSRRPRLPLRSICPFPL